MHLLNTQGGALARREHPQLATQLDGLVRSGELINLLPGILVVPDSCSDPFVRIRAATLWAPDGVLTGRSAAKMSFWPDVEVNDVTLAVPTHRLGRPGFPVSERQIPPEHVIRRDGVAWTSPAMTALDLVPEFGGDVIDRVLRCKEATLDHLWAIVEGTRRRGNVERRILLADSRSNPWSRAEREAHRLLRAAQISGWTGNCFVPLPDGGAAWVDIAFQRLKVAIEVDSWEFHGRYKADFENTWRRHNRLVAAGWIVLHFTWQQLTTEPEWVIARIRDVLALRA